MDRHERRTGIVAGVLASGVVALTIWAPHAMADDPPACDSNAATDQQCPPSQRSGAGPAKKMIGDVERGLEGAGQANPKADKPSGGLYVLINGVPTCQPVGVPGPPGARIEAVPGGPVDGRCTP